MPVVLLWWRIQYASRSILPCVFSPNIPLPFSLIECESAMIILTIAWFYLAPCRLWATSLFSFSVQSLRLTLPVGNLECDGQLRTLIMPTALTNATSMMKPKEQTAHFLAEARWGVWVITLPQAYLVQRPWTVQPVWQQSPPSSPSGTLGHWRMSRWLWFPGKSTKERMWGAGTLCHAMYRDWACLCLCGVDGCWGWLHTQIHPITAKLACPMLQSCWTWSGNGMGSILSSSVCSLQSEGPS